MQASLPVRVQPHIGESWSSITSRTAIVNGLTGPGEIHTRAGVAASRPRLPSEAHAIARVCGLPPELAHTTPIARSFGAARGEMKEHIRYYGHCVEPSAVLIGHSERICPLCVREQGFQLGINGFSLVTTCLTHSIRLIDVCPSCNDHIPILRPNIRTCRCRFDLATVQPAKAGEDELRVARLIDGRWRITFDRHAPTRPSDIPNEFWSMTLASLLRCLAFLHKATRSRADTLNVPPRTKTVEDLAPGIQVVGSMIANWPDGFHKMIDTTHRQSRHYATTISSSREISNLLYALHEELPEPPFSFLHKAMLQSIQETVKTGRRRT